MQIHIWDWNLGSEMRSPIPILMQIQFSGFNLWDYDLKLRCCKHKSCKKSRCISKNTTLNIKYTKVQMHLQGGWTFTCWYLPQVLLAHKRKYIQQKKNLCFVFWLSILSCLNSVILSVNSVQLSFLSNKDDIQCYLMSSK